MLFPGPHRVQPAFGRRLRGTPTTEEDTIKNLETAAGTVWYHPLADVVDRDRLARLPYVRRVFLENVVRHRGRGAGEEHAETLLGRSGGTEFPFHPARVVLQDFTGVPCVADLAAMRAAMSRLGRDPELVNPKIRADLVIDHSVIVDAFGTPQAFARNVELEFERNRERYAFLRWAQTSFRNFAVVPPGAGIVHQVNLEYLADVVMTEHRDGRTVAIPDTLVGTDSHTTMIGGLGVLGWGVGGIEAEAAMVGEPVTMLPPVVVGVRLDGRMPEGITATDLVLAVTELLRTHGVVGKFVEFYGPGLSTLTVADRATISNMSPEYGATEGIFPVDDQTLTYLRDTGRDPSLLELVDRYTKAQGLFHEPGSDEPDYDEHLTFDLSALVPAVAGPRRPQDRVGLDGLKDTFRRELGVFRDRQTPGATATKVEAPAVQRVHVTLDGGTEEIADGSVVIAAITSCTNTSNPSVMVGAGLLAKKAIERGLQVRPTVKTSLAPGSPVVIDYLRKAEVLEPLSALGFDLVGFGCTTCIGNSGPLPDQVADAIDENDLACAAVLSGNRNFEGRIHPQVRLSFLASPPLVVAYALAGTVDIDLTSEPLGLDPDGQPVHLSDVWPSAAEIADTVSRAMDPEDYRERYARIFEGEERWNSLPIPKGALYEWDPDSTYIVEPPFLHGTGPDPEPIDDVAGARCLVFVGDSVTTDHVSPAGQIPASSPAGTWLQERGVEARRLHSYGARRGNHEVMVRGTFANIRLRNILAGGKEGGYTVHLPSGEETTIYQAAERYRAENVPLVVLAGKEYGAGSSRDWAAKGTMLLGVRVVMAESYERIHRANLVQMGVLPLELPAPATELGLSGREIFDIAGLGALEPGAGVRVVARSENGDEITFDSRCRLDTETDVRYYRHGGILPAVVRDMIS